jgi:hypothetical protein
MSGLDGREDAEIAMDMLSLLDHSSDAMLDANRVYIAAQQELINATSTAIAMDNFATAIGNGVCKMCQRVGLWAYYDHSKSANPPAVAPQAAHGSGSENCEDPPMPDYAPDVSVSIAAVKYAHLASELYYANTALYDAVNRGRCDPVIRGHERHMEKIWVMLENAAVEFTEARDADMKKAEQMHRAHPLVSVAEVLPPIDVTPSTPKRPTCKIQAPDAPRKRARPTF